MKLISNALLIVIAVWFLGLVVTGGFSLQKRDARMGWLSSVEDWTEESEGEDDSSESEDDCTVCHVISYSSNLSSQSFKFLSEFNSLKEPISEIIPPPPKA